MEIIEFNNIERKIYTIRDLQVMLDSDLALLYATETKFINRAVKRNPLRFPESFVFQLSEKKWENLRFQIGTSSVHGGRRTMSHDRFLNIDQKELYHLGASLKDLGKQCLPTGQEGFAFSRMDSLSEQVSENLKRQA